MTLRFGCFFFASHLSTCHNCLQSTMINSESNRHDETLDWTLQFVERDSLYVCWRFCTWQHQIIFKWFQLKLFEWSELSRVLTLHRTRREILNGRIKKGKQIIIHCSKVFNLRQIFKRLLSENNFSIVRILFWRVQLLSDDCQGDQGMTSCNRQTLSQAPWILGSLEMGGQCGESWHEAYHHPPIPSV